jgi:DNA repair protein RadC
MDKIIRRTNMNELNYHVTIKELPSDDRPRERMQSLGPSALSNAELLAILLGGGFQNFSALNLAQHILQQHESLHGVSKRSLEELMQTKGIGLAKASSLLAAFELGKRIASGRENEKPVISSPESAAMLLMPKYGDRGQEHVGILALDTKNRVIKEEIVSVGTLDSSIAHPRDIFRPAVLANAAGIILFHNHPSGDPQPSDTDTQITERIKKSSKLVGIELLDHLIIGKNSFVSMKQCGLM